jgi:hypothetical protein
MWLVVSKPKSFEEGPVTEALLERWRESSVSSGVIGPSELVCCNPGRLNRTDLAAPEISGTFYPSSIWRLILNSPLCYPFFSRRQSRRKGLRFFEGIVTAMLQPDRATSTQPDRY